MRFTVPSKAIRAGTMAGQRWPGTYADDPNSKQLYRGSVCINPDYFEDEVDDPGYFWCTHKHEFNDCIHSKVVNGDGQATLPSLTDNQGWTYFQDQYLGLGNTVYGPPNLVGPSIYVKSYGDWGFIIEASMATSGSTHFLQARVQAYFYEHKTKKLWRFGKNNKVPTVTVYCRRRVETVYSPSGSTTFIYWEPTGAISYQGNELGFMTPVGEYLTAIAPVERRDRRTGARRDYASGTLSNFHLDTLHYLVRVANQMEKSLFNTETLKLDYRNCSLQQNSPPSYSVFLPPDALSVDKRFIFHEIGLIKDHTDPYLLAAGQDLSQYWYNVLIQNAYLDALQSVPRLNDNSISNILEIAGFIKSLVVDHRIEIPKSLSSAWLSYRYVYTTGKLDAEEAIEFVHRHSDLGTLDQYIKCFGVSHVEYQPKGRSSPVPVTCRCCLEIRPRDIAMLGKIWRALYTYGLQPNFYVIWDMIPYSFIIDWLIPIGKLASVTDASRMYSDTYYEIKDVNFSLSYDMQDEKYGDVYHQYTRYLSTSGVTLKGYYFFEEDPVSTKVLGYRILDGLSLIIGRRKK